ncbi:MAG: endonuclease domain-containing protein [Croceibacterium sp.]
MSERRTLSLRAPAERQDAAPRHSWNVSETRVERLKEMARAKRRNPTEAEKALWARLANQQLGGFKFHRQVVVGSTIVDFACPARWLVVEIAEKTNAEVDAIQDKKLAAVGIRVLRFAAEQLLTDVEPALAVILDELKKPFDRRAERATNAAGRPHHPPATADQERAEDEALFETAEESPE